MKGVDSTDSSPRDSFSSKHTTDSINTVSSVSMLYSFDDLKIDYRKCLKLLSKTEKTLGQVTKEKNQLQDKYNYLIEEHKNLQERMEILCHKYLSMQTRKSDEIYQLREVLNNAIKVIINKCAWSRITDCDDDEEQYQQFVQSLKLLKIRNICPTE